MVSLVREIALSRTWQLSSSYDEANFTIDPDNRRLWRMNPRRLEAEAVRDAMLAVSGQLKLDRPLGTYLREVGEGGVGQNVFEPVIRAIDSKTRSVYLPRVRTVLPFMLEVFDAPDASLVTGARETTSSPLQALFLLNNEFVQQQAVALAGRLAAFPAHQQVEQAYLLALSRLPTKAEKQLGEAFLAESADKTTTSDDAASNAGGRFGRFRGGNSTGARGRFGRRPQTAQESDSPVESESLSMDPLAIYCQALLSTMEFQMVD